jgi:hypothetical protein
VSRIVAFVRKVAWAACLVGGVAFVLAATPGPAHAQKGPDLGGGGGKGKNSTPEMDPQTAAGALALLSGGVLLLTDRFRRK